MPNPNNIISRWSHDPGYTCLAFSVDGKRLYTGGADSLVMIWDVNAGPDAEPPRSTDADAPITALTTSKDCWLSASKNGTVRRYAHSATTSQQLVTTVPGLAVRDIAFNPSGTRVAVTSDEPVVKIIDIEDITQVLKLEGGHDGIIRRVTWHPTESIVTTCGADGKIVVWDISSTEPVILHAIDDVVPILQETDEEKFDRDCPVIWHTSGKFFFAITRIDAIITVDREWNLGEPFNDAENTASEPITALALSSNGLYLASAHRGQVLIWSVMTRRIIARCVTNFGTICALRFSPTENIIAWTDIDGHAARYYNIIPKDMPDPVKPSIGSTASLGIKKALPKQAVDELFQRNLPLNTGQKSKHSEESMPVDDTADIDDDFNIDDIDDERGAEDVDDDDEGLRPIVAPLQTAAQSPFQPGATPFSGDTNAKCYLAFTTLGVIEAAESREDHRIIDVSFFDQSARRGYHFTDLYRCSMASLGPNGAAFACQPEGENSCALVLYKPHNSGSAWGQSGEWTYTLRPRTRILGIAAGGSSDVGHVVLATSEGDLTFISGTGRERCILGLGGHFLCMVAGDKYVFVVMRQGSTFEGSQSLAFCSIAFEDFTVRQAGLLPVPRSAILQWSGITDEGIPAIYDSVGYLHVLTNHRRVHQATWMRVLDTNLLDRRMAEDGSGRIGKDESYWPVGVAGKSFMCLIIKGRQKYPGFPRPLVQEIDLCFPFRTKEPDIEKLSRELYLLDTMRASADDDAEATTLEHGIDKGILLLIQSACKSNDVARALELARLIRVPKIVDAAVKIAEFYHLSGLRERLLNLRQGRTDDDAEDDYWKAPVEEKYVRPPPSLLPVESKALQNLERPPAIYRPGLERATAAVETTRYTRKSASESASMAGISDDLASVGTAEKRKRGDAEDVAMPPPKQKTNPFARKAPPQDNLDNDRNPFVRRTESRTVQKSESFFEKMDKAETVKTTKKNIFGKKNASGSKGNDIVGKKSGGQRQTTLFGLPAGSTSEVKRQGRKSKKPTEAESTPPIQDNLPDAPVHSNDEPPQDGVAQLEANEGEVPMTDATAVESQESTQWDSQQVGPASSEQLFSSLMTVCS
ncbi:hypothetical protein FISHEDRAFT_63502 [Fistulina hepatica ATCC 64428]|uniref:Uncharacterized protein n=1 Tax=Fistulina hepatica ATCC 64428 TaxID=1128425 RepID=A0A0D7AMK9_9AGAR|nr:hypothetical protein FISHEDRAFT_63502 [Fistulina hepatica ATCC 64428]